MSSFLTILPMNNQVIRTDKAPAPVGPYNQAIAAPGPFLFVAGQIPLDPVTGEIVSGEISAQTEQVMANLEGILTAAGANWSNVVKTTVFLSDLANFGAMNQVYARYFPRKLPRPGPVWRWPVFPKMC